MYSVREKQDGSYVVSLSQRGVVWHYSIDVRVTDYGDKLRIENGPSFDNLMDVRIRANVVASTSRAMKCVRVKFCRLFIY